MWLVGVVIRRYIDILIIIINFPYSTCIRSFLAAASLLLCSFLKCFFGLVLIMHRHNTTVATLTVLKNAQDCTSSYEHVVWYNVESK